MEQIAVGASLSAARHIRSPTEASVSPRAIASRISVCSSQIRSLDAGAVMSPVRLSRGRSDERPQSIRLVDDRLSRGSRLTPHVQPHWLGSVLTSSPAGGWYLWASAGIGRAIV